MVIADGKNDVPLFISLKWSILDITFDFLLITFFFAYTNYLQYNASSIIIACVAGQLKRTARNKADFTMKFVRYLSSFNHEHVC